MRHNLAGHTEQLGSQTTFASTVESHFSHEHKVHRFDQPEEIHSAVFVPTVNDVSRTSTLRRGVRSFPAPCL
jgi:hypothetical protein